MIRPSSNFLLSSLIAISLGIAGRGNAAIFLTHNFSGTLADGASLGGTPLAAETPFSIQAVFIPTSTGVIEEGFNAFDVTALSVTVAGHGSYSVDPTSWEVILFAVPEGEFENQPVTGLVHDLGGEDSSGFYTLFTSGSPVLDPSSPGPTVFSGSVMSLGAFIADLSGIPGGLTSTGLTISAASITPVPEPAETATAVGIGLGAFALIRNKRRKA